jgi:NAD(P)H-dependent flavin oxidoreductase YrpB (nitropropane dioxygenase family)
MANFEIIGAGMGVNISNYKLANTLARLGVLGTVSGVMLERIMARTLQNGDPGGDVRRALGTFPFPRHSDRVLREYYVCDGIAKGTQYKYVPKYTVNPSPLLDSLTVCANYVYIWLAKEGHGNPISINYLEKVAMHHTRAIVGAILAGVDYITMGAGIPFHIPNVINSIIVWEKWQDVSYPVPVVGRDGKSWNYEMSFNPKSFLGEKPYELKKPGFIPIISSNLLANMLSSKLPLGSIYGFVVEEPSAGGHNAPPRNKIEYSEKDYVVYSKLAELGYPFWIAGSKASFEKLKWAKSVGAQGIQAGTIFALCENSGMDPMVRQEVLRLAFNDELKVRTDFRISSTGFPFKVAEVLGTLSDEDVYETRVRRCDQGGLITLFEKEDGSIRYRCPAELVSSYVSKGGNAEDCVGRGCLCNGLFSTCGFGNIGEPPVVTLGDDFSFVKKLIKTEYAYYYAYEAVNYLTGNM